MRAMREILVRMSNLMITLPVLALPLMAWGPRPATAETLAVHRDTVEMALCRSENSCAASTKGSAALTGH